MTVSSSAPPMPPSPRVSRDAEALSRLADEIGRAEEGSRELDIQIDRIMRPHEYEPTALRPGDPEPPADFGRDDLSMQMHCAPYYTQSVDAALTLVPEGWYGSLWFGERPPHIDDSPAAIWSNDKTQRESVFGLNGKGATVALSLCIAALRARAAEAWPRGEADAGQALEVTPPRNP